MSEVIRLRTRAEIDEEAAAWIWRLDGLSAGAHDQREFQAWLRLDPRHQRAMDELSKVWSELDWLARTKPSTSAFVAGDDCFAHSRRGMLAGASGLLRHVDGFHFRRRAGERDRAGDFAGGGRIDGLAGGRGRRGCGTGFGFGSAAGFISAAGGGDDEGGCE